MIGRIDWAALARSIARVGTEQRSTVQLLAWLILGLWLVYQIMPARQGDGANAPASGVASQGRGDAHRRHAAGALSREQAEGNAAAVSAPDALNSRQALRPDQGANSGGAVAPNQPPAAITAPVGIVGSGPSPLPAAPAQGAAAPFAQAPGAGGTAIHALPAQVPPPPAVSHAPMPGPRAPAPESMAAPMPVDGPTGALMPGDPPAGGPERPLTQEEVDAIMGVTHPDPSARDASGMPAYGGPN
jgi:hypothetical protein